MLSANAKQSKTIKLNLVLSLVLGKPSLCTTRWWITANIVTTKPYDVTSCPYKFRTWRPFCSETKLTERITVEDFIPDSPAAGIHQNLPRVSVSAGLRFHTAVSVLYCERHLAKVFGEGGMRIRISILTQYEQSLWFNFISTLNDRWLFQQIYNGGRICFYNDHFWNIFRQTWMKL